MNSLRPLHALLVNGSPHARGNTAIALAEMAGVLEREDLAVEHFWIGTRPVRGCIACGACRAKTPHRCVFADDACNELAEKLAAADAVAVASPVYYGQPAGALLALLQRAFFSHPGSVDGKPVASIAVCRRGGSTAAFECLNMPFQMQNGVLAGSQYWNIAFGRTPGEAAKDEEGMQTMRTLARNLAWLAKNLNREGAAPRPVGEPWTPTHFIR